MPEIVTPLNFAPETLCKNSRKRPSQLVMEMPVTKRVVHEYNIHHWSAPLSLNNGNANETVLNDFAPLKVMMEHSQPINTLKAKECSGLNFGKTQEKFTPMKLVDLRD